MNSLEDKSSQLNKPNNITNLSIIVPFFNEEVNVDYFMDVVIKLLNRLKLTYEIICINDGSTDNTLKKLLNYHRNYSQVKVINFSRNFGKDYALTAGLRYSCGKAVIPMDCDLQDPPELIEAFLEKWRVGYDVVYAVRKKRHGETLMKRFTANSFYNMINIFSECIIPQNTGDFRLIDRKVVNVLINLPERTRFMKGLFAWVGFKQIGIPFERQARHSGRIKWNFWKLWNYALDGITLFSTFALRIWSYIGIFISLISFIYAIFIIIRVLLYGRDMPGYASIMVTLLFIGGLIMISLGIIGEYLARIYAEC